MQLNNKKKYCSFVKFVIIYFNCIIPTALKIDFEVNLSNYEYNFNRNANCIDR